MIDAELVEHQPVIFLILSKQLLEPFDAAGFLLFDGFDQVAVLAAGLRGGVVEQQLVIFVDLVEDEFFLQVTKEQLMIVMMGVKDLENPKFNVFILKYYQCILL